MPNYKSDRRLYLTRDRSRVVEHGDPEAAYLLVGEGGEVPSEEAERLGLAKMRRGPTEDKARKAPEEETKMSEPTPEPAPEPEPVPTPERRRR